MTGDLDAPLRDREGNDALRGIVGAKLLRTDEPNTGERRAP
jgi:hypothetical protein